VRAELPADVDVLRVARPAARHDRDVVEAVGLTRRLPSPDLNLQGPLLEAQRPRLLAVGLGRKTSLCQFLSIENRS
jgi:hypothetical protein